MIWINWKFINIRKRKKYDGWRVFILNMQLIKMFSYDLILEVNYNYI